MHINMQVSVYDLKGINSCLQTTIFDLLLYYLTEKQAAQFSPPKTYVPLSIAKKEEKQQIPEEVYQLVPEEEVSSPVPDSPSLRCSQSSPVVSGALVALTCLTSHRDVTFHWFKDGKEITGQRSQNYLIDKVGVSDSGEFSCLVASQAGPSPHSNRLTLTVTGRLTSCFVNF